MGKSGDSHWPISRQTLFALFSKLGTVPINQIYRTTQLWPTPHRTANGASIPGQQKPSLTILYTTPSSLEDP